MARMLTEEEVEKLEKQRELQSRAQAATDPNALYNQRMAAAHEAAMERRRGYIIRNPGTEIDPKVRNQVLRDEELRTARAHELGMQKNELETREYEARQKREGMENQGVEAAKLRSGYTDYNGKRVQGSEEIIAGLQNADKEKQRQHELAMLGQTQTFQGTQNDAERKNKLDIAGVQGKSTVEAAKAQAEARAADISAKNDIERAKIASREKIAGMRENGKLTQAGTAQLSKIYNGMVAFGYSPAVIRARLKEDGWTDEEINGAQGRQGQ